MTIDLSPIIISLRTATLSIIVTFFLGVAAAQLVFRLKSKTMKTILDGLFTLCFRQQWQDFFYYIFSGCEDQSVSFLLNILLSRLPFHGEQLF